MIAHRNRSDDIDINYTFDETKGTKHYCSANVYFDELVVREQDNQFEYQPCGQPLRRHKDGTEHCSTHGPMH